MLSSTTTRLLDRLRKMCIGQRPQRSRRPKSVNTEQLEARALLSATSFETEKVLAAAGATGDDFGWAVAIDGDTAIVGSRLADPGGISNAGAAAVYSRDATGSWVFQNDLNPGDAAPEDHFGYSVSIDGDTAVVGALYEDSAGKSGNGAAYVFVNDGAGNWSLEQKLIAAEAQDADRFGVSVDIHGDTIIAGAYLENTGFNNNGAAYVFTRSGSTWSQQQKLLADDLDSNDQFGFSVSVYNNTALVGAYGDNVGSNADQGSAYIFSRTGTSWSQTDKLRGTQPGSHDQFGRSVSLYGNYAVVGAPFYDPAGVDGAGRVYVFQNSYSYGWTQADVLEASDGAEGDNFGYAVDIYSGNILVGAHRHDHAGEDNSGSAYLFQGNSVWWSEVAKLAASDHEPAGALGFSVAVDDGVVLAAALNADVGATVDAGAVYSYTIGEDLGDAPSPYPTLRTENGARHTISEDFYLGATADWDTHDQRSPAADADDTAAIDDEDGVTFGDLFVGDTAATADVVVSLPSYLSNGYLDAWIDFNADGDWDDAGEQIYSAAIAEGTNTLTFSVPADAAAQQTYARFRLHRGTVGIQPTGPASAGEVEDYLVAVAIMPPTAVGDAFRTPEDSVLTSPNSLLANDSDPLARDLQLTAINGQPLSVSAGSEIATAVLNPAVGSTTSLNADNYYGFRFELTETTTIERVGGNFQFFTGTGPFAAIVALDNSTDLPDSENLSTPDVVATTVIPLAFQDDGEKSAEINAELAAGWYAVMFGTGQFGSTGISSLYVNNTPQGDFSFIHAQPGIPRFLTPSADASIRNARLFVTKAGGTLVPTDFTLPSGASLNVGPTGEFSYDPRTAFNNLAAGAAATETFSYTLRNSDGGEATGTATIDITGVNDAPTAAARDYVVSENSLATPSVANGLLEDATDPDTSDVLSVTQINGADIVSGQTVSLPSGAEFTVNSDGSFVYDPTTAFDGLTSGETGSDSLTFTISDGSGGAAQETMTVTINGFNDAPTVTALTDPIAIDEGETAALSGTLLDPEADATLMATLGEVTLAANGEDWTWTYESTDSAPLQIVTITATDLAGNTDSVVFDLTINHVPTVNAEFTLSADTVDEGELFTVIGSYTDLQPSLSHAVAITWDNFTGEQSSFSLPDPGSLTAGDQFVADGAAATLTVTSVTPAVLNPGMTTHNIHPGTSSTPSQITVADSYVLFVAHDGVVGNELWIYDENGPRLLKDINPGTGSSNAYGFVANGDLVTFAADDGVHGTELWITDGTTAGTHLIADLNSGGSAQPRSLVAFGNEFYFTANSDASFGALYRTDGTLAGTTQILSDDFVNGVYANAARPKVVGDKLYFRAAGRSADGSPTGEELFVTDGTAGGTRLMRDIIPGSQTSAVEHMTDVNGVGFFQVTNSSGKFELWKTDGTEAGTVLVSDIVPGAGSPGVVGLKNLTALNGQLYFGADDGVHGYELWKSDGTAGGTVRVTDMNTNGNGFLSGDFEGTTSMATLGDELFFLGQDTNGNFELWKSEGTPSGTIQLEINPGSSGSWAQGFASFGNSLAFIADDGTHGRELWVTDGTSAGTQLLVDSNPGSVSNQLAMLRSYGDSLVMRGSSRPSPGSSDDLEFWTYNPAGNPYAEVSFSVDYAYSDDRSAEGEQDRTVTLVVDNGEPYPATANQSITVANVAPELDSVTLSSNSVLEGEIVELGGLLIDPGSLDTHTVEVDWGDGTTSTATISPNTASEIPFSASHTYTVSAASPYPVTMTVADDDGDISSAADTVFVSNRAPEITNAYLNQTVINEGDTVTLTVELDDSPEPHTIDVDWGDGNVGSLTVAAGVTSASFDHTYTDDPHGADDTMPIGITVSDGDAEDSTTSLARVVNSTFDGFTHFGSSGGAAVVDLALDDFGNQYVAGNFAPELDIDGDLVASSGLSRDWFVSKFSAAGEHLWTRTVGIPGSEDVLGGIAVTASGNVHLSGTVTSGADLDPGVGQLIAASDGAAVVTLDSEGNHIDSLVLNGDVEITGVELGAYEQVGITGRFRDAVDFDAGPDQEVLNSPGVWNGFVAVYFGGGGLYWANQMSSTGDSVATALSFHQSGVNVVGYFRDVLLPDISDPSNNSTSQGSVDLYSVQFSTSGSYSWHATTGGTYNDVANDVVVADDGHVYIAGRAGGTFDADPSASEQLVSDVGVGTDPLLWALNSNGSLAWYQTLETNDSNSEFTAVDLTDDQVNVVAGGEFSRQLTAGDFSVGQDRNGAFLTVFDVDGAVKHATAFTGASHESLSALAVTETRQVLVGGSFNSEITAPDQLQELQSTGLGANGYTALFSLTTPGFPSPVIEVSNVAPVIDSVSAVVDPSDPSLVTVTAEFRDAGQEDAWLAYIEWGDESNRARTMGPGETTFTASHRFVDTAGAPADGVYEIDFTILDDDSASSSESIFVTINSQPSVSFQTVASAFNEAEGLVEIPVVLSASSLVDLTIPLAVTGSAVQGVDPDSGDYRLLTTEVFISAGQATGVVQIEIRDDEIDELLSDSITLELLESTDVTIGETPIHSVTIVDNDVVTFAVTPPVSTNVWEDHGSVEAVVSISHAREVDTLIRVLTSGTADATDYTVTSTVLEADSEGNAVLRIPAGQTSVVVQVAITNDTTNETYDESAYLLFEPVEESLQVGSQQLNLTIRDNDPLVIVGEQTGQIDERSINEGGSVVIAVSLSNPTNVDTDVPLSAYGFSGSPASANDFTVPSLVTIPGGTRTVQLTIPILEDNLAEDAEKFYIGATDSAEAEAENGAYITIHDNDAQVVTVSAPAIVNEGNTFQVTVSLSNPSQEDIAVELYFSGNSYVTGQPRYERSPRSPFPRLVYYPADYSIPNSVLRYGVYSSAEAHLTIPAGSRSAAFPVQVHQDGLREGEERVVISIRRLSDGEAGTAATFRIRKNNSSTAMSKGRFDSPVTYTNGTVVVTNRPATTVALDTPPILFPAGPDSDDLSNATFNALQIPVSGLISQGTLFFDANFNFRQDFLDLDGDGQFSDGDLLEPGFETQLDGSVFTEVPVAFDRNGNLTLDADEGQYVLAGGIDTSVDQRFESLLAAPVGYGIISPMTTLVSHVMQTDDVDVVTANSRTLESLDLAGFRLDTNHYIFNAAEGDLLAAEAYRTDVALASASRLIAALFENDGSADVVELSRLFYEDLAEKLGDAQLDLANRATLASLVRGVAFKLGTSVDAAVEAAATDIIADIQHRIGNVANEASRTHVDTLAKLHKTAEVELVPVIRSLWNHADPAQVASASTGTGLDALITATTVSNVLPPELYVADVAVQEGANGSAIAEVQVALRGGTDVPVSVSYGTAEGSASEFDDDYVPIAGELTWMPGGPELQTIQVEINGDAQFEPDEYFDLAFFDADGLVMRHDFGRIFILNDDGLSFTAEETLEPTNVRVVAYDDQIEVYQDDVLAFAGGISDSGPITISAFDSVETNFELEVLSAGPVLSNGIQFIGGSSELDTLVVSSTLTEGSQVSLTGATFGQVAFESGTVTFNGVEMVLDSLSASISVDGTLTEGSLVTLSAVNPAFPVEDGDSLSWTVTSDNGFVVEGSGQDFEFELGDNGNYEVELILERSGRGEVTAATAFSVTNTAPTATDDEFFVPEDAISLPLAVLENDDDPAGVADPLSVVSIDSGTATGTVELIDGTVSYRPDGNFETLALNETATETFSYTIDDGDGGTDSATVTLTITGENDAPIVTAPVAAGASEDEGAFSVDLLAGATDVDLSDSLNVDALTLASGDDSGVTIGDKELTIKPTAYNHLAVGESEVIAYSYNIVDGNGGTVPQTATITISGVNDDPALGGPVATAFTEDDATFIMDLLAGASDVDLSDVLSVDGLTLTSGDASGVTIGTNELTVDPAAYNHLGDGESEVVVYGYNVVDGNGGSVAQTATVTISGANDEVNFLSATSSHPDAANASPDGLVTLLGTVRDADTSDVLTLSVDWGDGSAVETLTVARPGDGFSIDHQYPTGGVFEISATVNDGNGSTQTVIATAAVEGVGLIGDALYFIGTDNRDKITIDETWVYDGSGWRWNPNNWDRRIVAFGQLDGGWFYDTFDSSNVASLQFAMLGGNDRVIVTSDVSVPVTADLGSGHDLAIIASGAASILAGDGNDEVWTGSGNDTVHGGAGDDLIGTDGGNDIIGDLSGDNTILSGSGNDSVTTGAGDDFIVSHSGDNVIDAGHGDNVIITGDGQDTVSAGEGDDNISTDGGSDTIHAGNGNNAVNAGSGMDIVITGNGNDAVRLGGGDDVALLGAGNDTARGGSGHDAIIGGDGDDDLRGQNGRDVLVGGRGADNLRAGSGDDLLISGRTSYDDDLAAIDAIMQAWTSDNSYAARVSALQTGTASGGVALAPGSSVFSDEDNDVLRGQGGQNWYFAGQSNDSVPNHDVDELVDWLDDLNL